MATATFVCAECNYSQKTAAENAGNEYTCPECGAVALAVLDEKPAPSLPPKLDVSTGIKTKMSSVFDTAKDAATKAASSANTVLTSATVAEAKTKLSKTVSGALSSASSAVSTVTEQAKSAASNLSATQVKKPEPAPSELVSDVEASTQDSSQPDTQVILSNTPLQATSSPQYSSHQQKNSIDKGSTAVIAASIYKKNLGIGLLLTLFFGGFGTLYASVGWGILFTLIEILLGGVMLLSFGIFFPVVFAFHLICIVFTVVSISNHNKRLAKALGVF